MKGRKEKNMFPIREVDDATLAFPAQVLDMMPAHEDIPQEFWDGDGKWGKLVSALFFTGVKTLDLKPRPGVDTMKALRHIRAILKSFQPKHEHKEAACAFLFNEWFEDAKWEPKPFEENSGT